MRSAQGMAMGAGETAGATAANLGAQGGAAYSQVEPFLSRELTGGMGYTPTQMANMLTAGEQGAGGAASGITGQANLQAARTRNTGGFSTALDEAARQRTRQLSSNALNVQLASAKQAQQNQQAAARGLQGLYGTGVSGGLEAQGLVPKDVEAATGAGQAGWFQNLTGLLGALNKGGGGG